MEFYPKLKTCFPLYKNKQGTICIGEVEDTGFLVENPPPFFLDLIELLDGRKSIPEIHDQLTAQNHDLSPESLIEIIDAMKNQGCIENGQTQPSQLSGEELEFYSRQLAFFSLSEKQGLPGYFYQEKLKSQKVIIFGMGGWGTWISLNLCQAGFGHLVLIDGDKIELSNLNRQVLFQHEDIGQLKSVIARDRLQKINPFINVKAFPHFVKNDATQIEKILEGGSLILICWSNLSYFLEGNVDYKIHELAFQKKIPLLEVSADPLEIKIGPYFSNNGLDPCFKCIQNDVKSTFYSTDPGMADFQNQALKRLESETHVVSWQSAPALSTMAGLVVDQAIKTITGLSSPLCKGTTLKLSLKDYKMTQMKYSKNKQCEWCSHAN